MADSGLYDKVKESIIHHTSSIRRIVETSDTTRKLFHDKLVESDFAFSSQIQSSKEKNYEYDDVVKQVLISLEFCKDQDQIQEFCHVFLTSLLELGDHEKEAIQLSRELREEWKKFSKSSSFLSKETCKFN